MHGKRLLVRTLSFLPAHRKFLKTVTKTAGQDAAQKVLSTLLDKYADIGVSEIETINVLKVKPLDQLGTPLEIVKSAFSSKKEYELAITELEAAIYSEEKASA